MIDLYKLLGVKREASPKTIRRAYLRKAREFHPDRNPGNEVWAAGKFTEIQRAYEVLGNPERRTKYDQTGETEEEDNQQLRQAVIELVEALNHVVSVLIGRGLRPANHDVVTLMRQHLRQGLKVLEDERVLCAKNRLLLKEIVERFVCEGTNYLQQVIKAQLEIRDEQLKSFDGKIELRRLSLNVLERFKFLVEVSAVDKEWGRDGGWDIPRGFIKFTDSH